MKTRFLILTLTLLIVLPLSLSSCAESEKDLEYVGEEVDQSYLNTLREKASTADDVKENNNNPDISDEYDEEFWKKEIYKMSAEETELLFKDLIRISGFGKSELTELLSEYSYNVMDSDDMIYLFAFAFQKGYYYGKNDLTDKTAEEYLKDYSFSSSKLAEYNRKWNFTYIPEKEHGDEENVPESDETEKTTIATDNDFYIISLTDIVEKGNDAKIEIRGIPNAKYSIEVHYSSGISQATGLESKISNADGVVAWKWKVGARTSPGTYRIVIIGGGERHQTTFTVK